MSTLAIVRMWSRIWLPGLVLVPMGISPTPLRAEDLKLTGSLRVEGAYSQASAGEFSIDAPFVPGGRLRILLNGDVGINRTNPNAKLHVVGSSVGVLGEALAPNGPATGVSGATNSPGGFGVSGEAIGGVGVLGSARTGTGIRGTTTATTGTTFGVFGSVSSPQGTGVHGEGPSVGIRGFASGTAGGEQGVVGTVGSNTGVGVRGENTNTGGPTVGVSGFSASPDGTAALFDTVAAGPAGPPGGQRNIIVGRHLFNNVFRVNGDGRVFANGNFQASGADFAESVEKADAKGRYEPGDVLVINQLKRRTVSVSSKPYSTVVAGIYSTKPGMLATPYEIDDPRVASEIPLSILGIVPCKVTAENGAIEIGDLLVTSSVNGHAMKGSDRARMLGAIVGKALEPMVTGTGTIQVLVTLQ